MRLTTDRKNGGLIARPMPSRWVRFCVFGRAQQPALFLPFRMLISIILLIVIQERDGHAQQCRAHFSELTDPLTQCCADAALIDDGSWIGIFWDRNQDGPDAGDSLAPVGNQPGEWNNNQFAVNGLRHFGQGYFYADEEFMSAVPCSTSYWFFLKVRAGPSLWTCQSVRVDTSDLAFTECGGWTCENVLDSGQVYRFAGTPVRAKCLTVCRIVPLTIEVPNCDASHIPRVRVEAGCHHLPVCNYPERTPAELPFEGYLPAEAWTRIDEVWYTNVAITSSGAICLTWQECSDLAVSDDENELVSDFSLLQNYPNPFNPVTEISFSLSQETEATLRVFNVLGREVAVLVHGWMSAGEHSVTFDGRELAAGVYFYRMEAGDFFETKKMLLLK